MRPHQRTPTRSNKPFKGQQQLKTKTSLTNDTKDTWESLSNNKSLVKACMSRNRDLNGDGKITQDEVKWYVPTIEQYAGLWIGEEVIHTDSKLFNRSTSTIVNDPDDRMEYGWLHQVHQGKEITP